MQLTRQMLVKALTSLALAGHFGTATASDACSTRAIVTAADVTVSDGSEFRTESFFQAADAAAIRHIDERDQLVAVEGPIGWARLGDRSQAGAEFHKQFALGHQYHAFLLHFDELVADRRASSAVTFMGSRRRARSGDYPYGGTVHLVEDQESGRASGFVFELPGAPVIEVVLSDWRDAGNVELPFRAEINDGERVFDYRYASIDIAARSPLWFYDAVGTPDLDPVKVHRLHRTLLAAHCLGDADLMANLSAGEVVSANDGELHLASNASIREMFTALFERLDYTAYYDIATPVIEIAESSDVGWIAVNVRAVGADKATGDAFDSQWAWLMTVRKVDGRWLHAGNASNVTR